MTELINESEFATAIDIIADRLGIAVTEIFEIFVEAQATIGVLTIAIIFAAILTCLISYFIMMKLISGKYTYRNAIKKLDRASTYTDSDTTFVYVVAPVIVAVITLFVSALIFECVGDGLIRILCPEYTAITDIISIVKP